MSQGFAPPTTAPASASSKKLKRSIIEEFKALDDPRTKREPQHLLIDIVTILILAVISGADLWKAQAGVAGDIFRVTPRNSIP